MEWKLVQSLAINRTFESIAESVAKLWFLYARLTR